MLLDFLAIETLIKKKTSLKMRSVGFYRWGGF